MSIPENVVNAVKLDIAVTLEAFNVEANFQEHADHGYLVLDIWVDHPRTTGKTYHYQLAVLDDEEGSWTLWWWPSEPDSAFIKDGQSIGTEARQVVYELAGHWARMVSYDCIEALRPRTTFMSDLTRTLD